MTYRAWALALSIAAVAGAAEAQSPIPDSRSGGKLLLTGGVSTIEGSGGGGLSTWGTITGYGEEDGIGGNAHVTIVDLPDYQFRTAGLAVGLWDRVELSAARQEFDTETIFAVIVFILRRKKNEIFEAVIIYIEIKTHSFRKLSQ